jgi:carbonic anhydrase
VENSEPILATLVKQGTLKVVGARYDLDDGLVEIVC